MLTPLHTFRFDVEFQEESLTKPSGKDVALCAGSFSECNGLEATMEPAVIREGGRNYGDLQRAGRVTFGTVILRRGITTNTDLWRFWELVQGGAYAYRLKTIITVRAPFAKSSGAPGAAASGKPPAAMTWVLRRCLPVKFKAPDLNANGAEIGIEELHLVHEGLILQPAPAPSQGV